MRTAKRNWKVSDTGWVIFSGTLCVSRWIFRLIRFRRKRLTRGVLGQNKKRISITSFVGENERGWIGGDWCYGNESVKGTSESGWMESRAIFGASSILHKRREIAHCGGWLKGGLPPCICEFIRRTRTR